MPQSKPQSNNQFSNRIGDYVLGKTVGVGSFSKVKLAQHIPTGRKVAIKILNRRKLRLMEMGDKAKREIGILRKFNHPHIIRLYEVIDTPSDIFVVMEYVSGGELFDYIVEHGKLPEVKARRFFQQIISGLDYCHRWRVCHRDLKPENLLLDANGKLRIADFGLSNHINDGDFLKTSCGSPNYAAPEVISGDMYSGPEVDIWSCGVILFALLAGNLPFDDENIPNLFRLIKAGKYTIPSHISSQAVDLITRMLTVDPCKRITIPDIKNHPWFCLNVDNYLNVSPDVWVQRACHVDLSALELVAKILGCQKVVVEQALVMGDDLRTRQRYRSRKYQHLRRASVTYQLVRDSIKPCVKWKPRCQSSCLRDAYVAPGEETGWRMGIHTCVEPKDIILFVLKCLRFMGMEWKFTSKFGLEARKVKEGVDKNQVKLGFQLYVNSQEEPNSAVTNLTGPHIGGNKDGRYDFQFSDSEDEEESEDISWEKRPGDGKLPGGGREKGYTLDVKRISGGLTDFLDVASKCTIIMETYMKAHRLAKEKTAQPSTLIDLKPQLINSESLSVDSDSISGRERELFTPVVRRITPGVKLKARSWPDINCLKQRRRLHQEDDERECNENEIKQTLITGEVERSNITSNQNPNNNEGVRTRLAGGREEDEGVGVEEFIGQTAGKFNYVTSRGATIDKLEGEKDWCCCESSSEDLEFDLSEDPEFQQPVKSAPIQVN